MASKMDYSSTLIEGSHKGLRYPSWSNNKPILKDGQLKVLTRPKLRDPAEKEDYFFIAPKALWSRERFVIYHIDEYFKDNNVHVLRDLFRHWLFYDQSKTIVSYDSGEGGDGWYTAKTKYFEADSRYEESIKNAKRSCSNFNIDVHTELGKQIINLAKEEKNKKPGTVVISLEAPTARDLAIMLGKMSDVELDTIKSKLSVPVNSLEKYIIGSAESKKTPSLVMADFMKNRLSELASSFGHHYLVCFGDLVAIRTEAGVDASLKNVVCYLMDIFNFEDEPLGCWSKEDRFEFLSGAKDKIIDEALRKFGKVGYSKQKNEPIGKSFESPDKVCFYDQDFTEFANEFAPSYNAKADQLGVDKKLYCKNFGLSSEAIRFDEIIGSWQLPINPD